MEFIITPHKLCDSCHNFVDHGIKRRINAENECKQSGISGIAEREKQRHEAVLPVALTWKEIWCFVLYNKKDVWGNVFFVSLLFYFEREKV